MKLIVLIHMCTDKVTRGAAIITARAWVTQAGPLDQSVRSFALDSLQHLGAKPKEAEGLDGSAQNGDAAKENGDADEQAPPESEIEVQRFVELPFALCVKVPEMLDE